MDKLKLALVQHRVGGTDRRQNTEEALHFLRVAKEQGADLVLFPECFLTGYQPPEILTSLPPLSQIGDHPDFKDFCENALTPGSEPLRRVCQEAKALSIGAVITGFSRGERYPRNTAFLIGKDGEIALTYSKVHTCDFDWEQYLESGEGFYVADFCGVKIGLMICYDREYPESARELMLAGAELILVPNDCSEMAPRLRELSVRAMENMVGVAMANPPGKRFGRSCAFSPAAFDEEGQVVDNTLLLAPEEEDGVFCVTFDLDFIREYRRREDLGKYRKVSAYRHLTKKE